MPSISNNHVRSEAEIMVVRPRPGKPSQGLLAWGNTVFPCALGHGGIRALKREGDGATPLGATRLLYGWFRHGKIASRRSGLPLRQIAPSDGWCDAPPDANYNRPVKLPYRASSETMERKDRLYDCCIVMDYNIRPRRRGMGSAIFFHIAKPGFPPTQGCIAVEPKVMQRLLPHLSPRTRIKVVR